MTKPNPANTRCSRCGGAIRRGSEHLPHFIAIPKKDQTDRVQYPSPDQLRVCFPDGWNGTP